MHIVFWDVWEGSTFSAWTVNVLFLLEDEKGSLLGIFICSTGIDDKRRRLRGFLTCMKSDTPLMLNTSYVPQHLLVMACVLR